MDSIQIAAQNILSDRRGKSELERDRRVEEFHRKYPRLAELDREIKVAEQSYGPDHLRMVLARTYLTKLVANARVERWLQQHQPEMLAEFRKLVDGQTAVA